MSKINYNDALEMLREEQRYFYIGKEREYEEYVKENLYDICENLGLAPIIEIQQQPRFEIDNFSIKPDLIVIHKDNTVSIFEIKKTNSKYPSTAPNEQCRAIGQILLYKNIIETISKKKTRAFLVDEKIHIRTLHTFKGNNLPITLMEIQNDRVFIPYKSL